MACRVIEDLSYNYYFDISELVDAGYSIDDVKVQKGTDQHSGDEGVATVSDPIHYEGNIYYVKITFGDGRVVMPTGQSEHRSELPVQNRYCRYNSECLGSFK